jgi:hypothetical protein
LIVLKILLNQIKIIFFTEKNKKLCTNIIS